VKNSHLDESIKEKRAFKAWECAFPQTMLVTRPAKALMGLDGFNFLKVKGKMK
jgi:hypothetical protein